MSEPTCSIDDCDRPVESRGWCKFHYQRWRLKGDTFAHVPPYGRLRPPSTDLPTDLTVEDTTFVYIVRSGTHVKVGFSSEIERRLRGLRTSSPVPIMVVLVAPGGRAQEAVAHRLLAPWRSHGEWFYDGPHVERLVSAMRVVVRMAATHDLARAWLMDVLHDVERLGGLVPDAELPPQSVHMSSTGPAAR